MGIKAKEEALGAAEKDRADKDDQIRTMKEEVEHQNDMIGKLAKEKKGCHESRQRTEEDIQSMEDKCNHLARVKGKLEQLDVVKRENKNLADEIKDLLDQLGDGGRSIHELDKQRRRLEVEKEELQAALEEAEAALEQEENKVLRAQLELGQVRQEIDRKIQEKEEEFNNTRKNHGRAMDSMQASLETEQRAKAEALRIKKKLESDINELEIALDHANKANSEAQKSIKRYQNQFREVEGALEEEHRQHVRIAEKAGLAERKANALHGELEESRALLDSADRGKKQCEMELAEARSAVNDMTAINSKAMNEKRQLESACHTLHAEIDDCLHQAKNSEDKAKKAMVDAASWQMNSVPSKTMPPTRRRPRGPWSLRSTSWRTVWLKPTRWP